MSGAAALGQLFSLKRQFLENGSLALGVIYNQTVEFETEVAYIQYVGGCSQTAAVVPAAGGTQTVLGPN